MKTDELINDGVLTMAQTSTPEAGDLNPDATRTGFCHC